MPRLGSGWSGRGLALALVAAVTAAAWYNRHELVAVIDGLPGREPEVSERLADAAATRLAGLGRDGVTRVAFHEAELQSLIQYRWARYLPEGLGSPRVALGDGRVTLEGRVSAGRFGGVPELREIIAFLPDTAALRAVGSLVPLDSAHVAVEVHELGAAGVPIPKRLIPPILDRLRGDGLPAVGPNALAVPLPPAIGRVYVSGDSLVVAARSPEGA